LPFVGTENGGPQDIRENCESGLLVDVNDREALTGAMKRLLTDREYWEECSNNGVNRVREFYTWKRQDRLPQARPAVDDEERRPIEIEAACAQIGEQGFAHRRVLRRGSCTIVMQPFTY
jgi:sucrose-phosphate synthase